MSRKADCWDIAVAESFFATLEKELLADLPILPAEQTTQRVDAYIDRYYNVARRHSTIDFKSPIAYELETHGKSDQVHSAACARERNSDMSSGKGKVLRVLSGLLLNRATVVDVKTLGGFRRIVLDAKVAPFAAGTKVQVLLPSNDVRTYSPIASPDGVGKSRRLQKLARGFWESSIIIQCKKIHAAAGKVFMSFIGRFKALARGFIFNGDIYKGV